MLHLFVVLHRLRHLLRDLNDDLSDMLRIRKLVLKARSGETRRSRRAKGRKETGNTYLLTREVLVTLLELSKGENSVDQRLDAVRLDVSVHVLELISVADEDTTESSGLGESHSVDIRDGGSSFSSDESNRGDHSSERLYHRQSAYAYDTEKERA